MISLQYSSTYADSSRQKHIHLLPVALVGSFILAAFAVRLVGVTTRPFWPDEGLTLYQIQLSISQILAGGIEVQGVMTQNTHPPLYFLLLRLFGRLVGYGQLAVRWFSIAWSLLTIPIMFNFGRRLMNTQAGLLAALLGAASPLYLWYAQEVRMYSMLVCLSALSGYLFWRVLTERTRRMFLAYTLATILLLWTHYAALFVVAVQALVLSVSVSITRPKALFAVATGMGMAVVPFAPFIWRRLRSGVERDFAFVELETIARDLLHSFTSGVTMQIEGIWYFDLIIMLFVLTGAIWLWRHSNQLFGVVVPALLVMPPLFLYAATYIKPMYQNVRHLIVVSPFFYLLAAIGIGGFSRWQWRHVPTGGIVAGIVLVSWGIVFGAGTVNHFTSPRYQKDDTRSMFAYIADNFHPGDLVVLSDAVLSHVLEYEQPRLPWTALPNYGTKSNTPQARRQFEETLAATQRVWFVSSPWDSLLDPDRLVKQWFEEETDLLDVRKFRGKTIGLAVSYRDTDGAIAKQPFQVSERLKVSFSDGIDVYGALFHDRTIRAGETFFFDVVWLVRKQPRADYKVSVALYGPDDQRWQIEDQVPFPQVHPTSHWIAGDYLRSPHQLQIPAGTPPGRYEVRMRLYDEKTGTPVRRLDGAQALSLGYIDVQPGTIPKDWQPMQPKDAYVGDVIRVDGVSVPETLTVGETAVMEFSGTTRQTITSAPRVRVELVNNTDVILASQQKPLFYDEVVPEVPAGTFLRGRYRLAVPPTAAPGAYSVRAVFLNESGRPLLVQRWWGLRTAPLLTLDNLTIQDRTRRFTVPEQIRSDTKSVTIEWAQQVQLTRVGLPETGNAGESIPVTLVWQAGGPTDRNYKVFVQLRDAENNVVAQDDAYPAGGAALSTSWTTGEIVVDKHTIRLPSKLQEGRYYVFVGLYEEASGDRLPLSAPVGKEYRVGTLTVRTP